MKIKQVTCPACGSPKMTESKTAYIYCDFCAQYIDLDFKKAINSKGSKMPGPEYRNLYASMQGEINKAIRNKDKEAFEKCHNTLWNAYIDSCPAMFSPKIKNKGYRDAMVKYMTEQYWLTAITKELAESEKRMDDAIVNYQKMMFSPNKSGESAFMKLFYTYKDNTELVMKRLQEAGILDIYPDRVTPGIVAKASYSFFVEGWMNYASEEDIQKVIEITELEGRYIDVEPPQTNERHCGNCGSKKRVVEGSKKVLCEECGTNMNVAKAEIACMKCSAPVSFPEDKNEFSCPYCDTLIREL